MARFKTVFLVTCAAICTVVRANAFSGGGGLGEGNGIAPSTRSFLDTDLEGSFSTRGEDEAILNARSASWDYDELLYTRDLLDDILAIRSMIEDRSLREDVHLEGRALLNIGVLRAETDVHEAFRHGGMDVNRGKDTWTKVKDYIVDEYEGEILFEKIHLIVAPNGEPGDDDKIPKALPVGTIVRYSVEQDAWEEWLEYCERRRAEEAAREAARGNNRSAGGRVPTGKGKKADAGKGSKVGAAGKPAKPRVGKGKQAKVGGVKRRPVGASQKKGKGGKK